MGKKLYRIWYLVYMLDDEEDFIECEVESAEEAKHWFHEHFKEHVTYIEEVFR